MKLFVNPRNYTRFIYDAFIDRHGNGVPRIAKPTYEVGQVVYVKTENALGVVLGVIDEQTKELRTDMSGMVSFEDLEPAAKKSFDIKDIRFVPKLKKEVNGEQVEPF